MSGTTATETPSKPRRQREVKAVAGTSATTTGCTGLPSTLVVTRCPECGARRRHVSDGLRRCPGCRTTYRIVVTAVIA